MKYFSSLILAVLFFFLTKSFESYAQFSFEAKILDNQTQRPIPFANIAAFVNGSLVAGASSNLDGYFLLKVSAIPDSVLISCVGFSKILITSFDVKTVFLKSRDKELAEVVILPGVNPALRIIKNAVDNRKLNDVQQFLDFSYEAYNIFNADAEMPSQEKIDSLHIRQDSNALEFVDFFRNKQAFVSETYSHVEHKPINNKKELIVATQTSGLENPILSIFANQVQPFSAYKNPMELFSKEYLNPITNSGMKGYFYLLQDTTYLNKDTIFSIYFYPKPKSSFAGMRGTVYINAADWSIQKIIFNFSNPFGVELNQDEKGTSTMALGREISDQNFATIIISYDQINQYWFPVEVRTIYPLGQVSNEMPLNIFNTSYFRNYAFGEDLQRVKTSGAPLKVALNEAYKNSDFWNEIRGEHKDERMDSTYIFMDSISKKAQLDKLLMFSEALIDGQLKLGYVNVDMNKILRFNDFEGFRLGLGMETNERVLKSLRFGGYFGYGFRDKVMKYGGHMRAIFLPAQKLEAKVYYLYDMNPTGLPTFVDPIGRIDQSEFIRSAYVRRMDYNEVWGFKIGSYLYRSMHLALSTEQRNVAAGYDYFYNNPNQPGSGTNFDLFETKAEFSWRIKDRYVQLGDKRLYLHEPRNPIINVQYTRGWDNIGRGDYAYDRFLFRISQQFKALRLGKLLLRAEYQKTFGAVPIQMLFHTPGTFSNRFGVSAYNIFETVRPNEFLNDEFIAAFINFEFNPWRIRKDKFEPIIGLRFNAGWGQLDEPTRHQLVSFETMNKGFFEAGIVFDNLLNLSLAQYGFGVFYRIGAYKYSNEWNNLAFKLSLRLGN